MTDPERVIIQWNHPVNGRQSEVVCPAHERQLLKALKTLHIGCSGTAVDPAMSCDRCRNGASDG